MKGAALLVLALLAPAAWAQEPSVAAILGSYVGAESYCDSGTMAMRSEPAHGFQATPFERCAHRDGRFKMVELPGQRHQQVSWSDGKVHRVHHAVIDQYRESTLRDPALFGLYEQPGSVFPVFVLRLYAWDDSRRLVDPAERQRYIQGYRPVAALSTPEHAIHERPNEAWPRNSERIWVRRSDGAVTRYEGLRDGAVLRYVDFASRRVGAPLTEADLSHSVNLMSKVSLRNNPAVFVALLFAAALAAGALGWGWLLASRPREQVLHWRRRAWLWQLRALAVVAVLLLGLGLLTLIGPDKGHPPAIVIVYLLAIWAAVGFGLLAAITLAGHLVQPFVRRREA